MAMYEKRGNSYRITVYGGYDKEGKQIKERKTWKIPSGMTEKQAIKEVKRLCVLLEEQYNNGGVIEKNIRFSTFSEMWFNDYAEKKLKPKTLARYEQLIIRIKLAIGEMRMDKIKPHHVNEFYNNLEEKGVREDTRYKCVLDVRELLKQGNINKKELAEKSDVAINTVYSFSKNQNINFASAAKIALALNYDIESMFKPIGKEFLSKTTIHHYHSLLNTMFNSAVKWGIININPCSRVESPRLGNMKKVYLDDKQAIRLINLLENEKPQYKMMINLFLETGFRRGELCGLKWEDIDFKNDIIYVRRQLIYVAQKGVLETTGKTESALRTIKVSKRIMGLLKEYKHWQLEERIKVGDRWEDRDMLFTTWCGKPMHPDTITKWFGEFVKKHDFPPVTIHSLRHTNASILIARGTPITTVSKRLGHSNAAVTGKIYAHEFQTADEIAASVIESVFNNSHIC